MVLSFNEYVIFLRKFIEIQLANIQNFFFIVLKTYEMKKIVRASHKKRIYFKKLGFFLFNKCVILLKLIFKRLVLQPKNETLLKEK